MTKISIRGFDKNDKRWFSHKEINKLKKAKEEIEYLLNREYKLDPVVTFVGDRYQFSIRQRDALKRAVCSLDKLNLRNAKRLPVNKLKDGPIFIDGFNLIITLEVALSNASLIKGSDKNIRDLAGLRGTYKIIDKTEIAIKLIGKFLEKYNCKQVKVYLDSPVSNSGNLRYKILECFNEFDIDIDVELVNNADVVLEKLGRIVSSDAVILDKCISYFNLCEAIINDYIKEADIIDLS